MLALTVLAVAPLLPTNFGAEIDLRHTWRQAFCLWKMLAESASFYWGPVIL